MPRGIPGYLRWALVRPGAGGARLVEDLPHIGSQFSIRAMQPGNPSSAALGSFRIQLPPPYTPAYKKAKNLLGQIDYFTRLEAYLGYSAKDIGLGKLVYAGILDRPDVSWGKSGEFYELSGKSDLLLAHLSKPFPGERLSNDVTSELIKSYLGTNEMPWGDNFNPYTSGNYNSSNLPTHTSGSWTADADDGLAVVKCSTGNGAALISKVGGAAGDRWHSHYVEATGRMFTSSTHAVNSGVFGVGITKANNNCSDSIVCWAQAQYFAGRYNLVVTLAVYVGGALNGTITSMTALPNADENASAYIPITIGLLNNMGGAVSAGAHATVTLNGRVVDQISLYATSTDPGTVTWYPFLVYGTPTTGSMTGYFSRLKHYTRFTYDGPSTASAFKTGTITATGTSLQYGTDAGATFLEAMSRLATRNSQFWRYTPQPYVAGVRTLGTIDLDVAPGTDLASSRQVVFSRANRNLLGLGLPPNADYLVGDTATSGQPTIEGGGIGYFSDIAALQRYGVLQDETWAFTNSDFASLRRAAYQIIQNKASVGPQGAKVAIVLRDPATADKWRELDRVGLHDPEVNASNLSALVLGRDFVEGSPFEGIHLDQFAGA